VPPPSFAALLPSDMSLDGELWAGRGGFHRAGKLLSRSDVEEGAWAQLTYVVYDAPEAGGGFLERMEFARARLATLAEAAAEAAAGVAGARPAGQRVLVTATWPCQDVQTKDLLLQEVLEMGGEGLILRRQSSVFYAGVSPARDMLKVKPFADAEALILPPVEARPKKSSVRVRCLNGNAAGREFYITTVDTLTKPPGTVVTFRYQHGGPVGVIPRHAFITHRHVPTCDCDTCGARRESLQRSYRPGPGFT